jgi:hypothetical protein
MLQHYKARAFQHSILSAIIVYTAFPDFDLLYSTGVDGPLPWVFNYLFDGRLATGKDIVFPHGPLAFLLYPVPLGSNLAIATLFYTLVQFLFCMLAFSLYRPKEDTAWLTPFLLLLLLMHLLDIQLLLIGTIASLYLLTLRVNKSYGAYTALALSSLAVFIKSYVGIISCIISLSFIILFYFQQRNWKKSLLLLSVLPVTTLLIWLLMYGTASGFGRFIYGQLQLAADNSAAAAYYPENNWWLLTIFIGSFIIIPLLNRNKETYIFYALFAGAVFAGWKHGMSRQDISHSLTYFILMCLFCSLLLIYTKEYLFRSLFVAIVGLVAFYMNLKTALYYEEMKLHAFRFNTTNNFLLRHQELKEFSAKISQENVQQKKLDSSILNIIAGANTDVYPWDYSYLPANNLPWVPRPVLHSYASYTRWLDQQNSDHFFSQKAPAFLLWDIDKNIQNLNTELLSSIDGRYLLNDEPKTLRTILSNYKLVKKSRNALLFKKETDNQLGAGKIIRSDETTWDEWTSVPFAEDGILRAKVSVNKSLAGHVKSFLYKDEETFVYLLLDNNEIIRHKIVPQNAVDGIWINPLIRHPETDETEPLVKKIRFASSNKALMQNKIRIEWEQLEVSIPAQETDPSSLQQTDSIQLFKRAYGIFKKTKKPEQQISHTYSNSFETLKPIMNWHWETGSITYSDFFSSPFSNKLLPGKFSATFKVNTDSLRNKAPCLLSVGVWIKGSRTTKAKLVVSAGQNSQNIFWEGTEVKNFIIDEKGWNYVFVKIPLKEELLGNGKQLEVYLWNEDQSTLFADDFTITLAEKMQK